MRSLWLALVLFVVLCPMTDAQNQTSSDIAKDGDVLLAEGKISEAWEKYQAALGAVASAGTHPDSPDGTAEYYATRATSDLPSTIRTKLTESLSKLQASPSSLEVAAAAAAHWPPTGVEKSAIVQFAQQLTDLHGRTFDLFPDLFQKPRKQWGSALPYLASFFSAAGERTMPFTTKLPDNQAFLDHISSTTGVEQATIVLRAINSFMSRKSIVSDETLVAAASAWVRAEALALEDNFAGCAAALQQLANANKGCFLEPLAMQSAGEWLLQAGRYEQAKQCFMDALVPKHFSDTQDSGRFFWCGELGLAELDFALGKHWEADVGYSQIDGYDFRVSEWVALRRGQCAEFTGEWDKACEWYKTLATAKCFELREESCFALKRLETMCKEHKPALKPAVSYLGEDRSTRGDWYNYYGSEAFVLCAQQAPDDIVSRPPEGWSIEPSTGTAEKTVRRWITPPGQDDHASFLYNPISHARRAANWDDRGEAYCRGTGPDLWLDISVPAGQHRLSLYFVNDRNYYEPRRAYTISVFDEAGKYQCGTDVRNFVNGVYKQFAVEGPSGFRMSISRNLSMNALLSGAFLDPLDVPVPKSNQETRAFCAWRNIRRRHLSPTDEQVTFARWADDVNWRQLTGIAGKELAAHRWGPATWAMQVCLEMLPQKEAKLAFQERVVKSLFNVTPAKPVGVVVAWPLAMDALDRYVALGTDGNSAAAAGFLRGIPPELMSHNPWIPKAIRNRLRQIVGDEGLSIGEHLSMSLISDDPVADVSRLEKTIARAGLQPRERGHLQLQLLGRYLKAGQVSKAETLVQSMLQTPPDTDQTANALYTLATYYIRNGKPDLARPLLEEIVSSFPETHWAEKAQKRLGKISPAQAPAG